MSENRRMSTRHRGEPPAKKRATTPPPPPRQPTPKAESVPAADSEASLPTRLRDDGVLPTCATPQPSDLLSNQFHNINDSGVLAASIDSSRQKWLSGGMFQKYWTKPTKKKGVPEVENPSKESMAKLGSCKLIVEPHTFDVTLYTIRETTYSAGSAVAQPSSHYETPWQHESPYSNPTQPSRSPALPAQPPKARQDSRSALPPFGEGFAQYDPSFPAPVAPKSIPPPPPMLPPQHYAPTPAEPPKQDSSMHADPVIQMLAARASSDPILKALMKDVAAGIGTPSQLKTFQSHIDELHEIIKRDNACKASDPFANTSQPPPPPPSTNTYGSTYANGYTAGSSINSHAPSYPETPVKQEPTQSSPFAYLRQPPTPIPKYKPPPQPRQEVTGVAFDLTAGSGDRFLIPKQSILEYLPGYTSVLVSFLLLHNNSDDGTSGNASNKANEGSSLYYQPITIQLHGNSKHLEHLAKVVKPQEEVAKYMNDVMDKKKPLKPSFLALRLPKTYEASWNDTKQVHDVEGEDVPKKSYEAPNLLRPMYVSAQT